MNLLDYMFRVRVFKLVSFPKGYRMMPKNWLVKRLIPRSKWRF